MSNNNIEIEVKFPLKNPDFVKTHLNSIAKLISTDVFQRDTYYTPAHRNFLKVQYPFEWLRLRESDKGVSINYKHFYPENIEITEYCDEYESKIENVNTLQQIFKSIDCRVLVVVEKVRTTWIYNSIEIVIDDVKALGSYIELEATTSFKNPLDGKRFLYSVLKELKAEVGEEDYRGYPYRLLEKIGAPNDRV